MLKNIKSKFIFNKIFSQLDYCRKLKLFSHNKELQKLLNINEKDYQLFSGKYIITELNGEKKEFNILNGNLIYEGGYLKGKKHGKGKEYDEAGRLIFEGEYHFGLKLKGKGREFSIINGALLYEGEYLKDKRNGKGKEFDQYGNLIYEGGYMNDKRHGKGKEYYDNGKLSFEGEFYMNLKFNGKGYTRRGNITYELTNGKGIYKEFYDNGTLKFIFQYMDDVTKVTGKEYNKKGKIKFGGEYFYHKRWNGKG